jgi:ribose transport system substrate-binding protein
MKRKVKFLALVLAVLMVFTVAVTGCKKAGPAAKKQTKIVFVAPLIANPYWDTVEAGAKAAAKDLNVNLQYEGGTTLDLNEWMKYIETAIAEKCDGICTMAENSSSIQPLVAEAKAAKIPVTLVDTDAPDSGRNAYAGTNNEAAGKTLGTELAKIVNGTATIGLITGALDQANLNQRVAGFKEGIQSSPNMKIVAFGSDNSDLQQCIQQGESMLKAHPTITAMVGTEGYGVGGIGRVVQEAKEVGKITVVGMDDVPDTLTFLKEKVASLSVVQHQYRMGYLGIQYLTEILAGKSVPSITDTGTILLTPDNVATYKPAS